VFLSFEKENERNVYKKAILPKLTIEVSGMRNEFQKQLKWHNFEKLIIEVSGMKNKFPKQPNRGFKNEK